MDCMPHQASLSITNSWSLLMSIESVMPFTHLIISFFFFLHLILYLCLLSPTKSRSSRWKSWASVVHHSQGLALGLELRWRLRLDAPAAEPEMGIPVQVSLEGGLPGEGEGGKDEARPQLEVSVSLIPGSPFIKE